MARTSNIDEMMMIFVLY